MAERELVEAVEEAARRTHDVVVVGGGTAGAVIAARLATEHGRQVCLIEAGPSDVDLEHVLRLKDWLSLLESDLDFDYTTVLQPRGNSHIRHARARVLGGCSSHNTLISFLPAAGDLAEWEARGATGWGMDAMRPYWDRLRVHIEPVAEKDRNAVCRAVIASAHENLGLPVIDDYNAAPFSDGAGFLSIAYDPETGKRESSSVAYLHPILGHENLTLLTETRALRLELEGGRARAVVVRAMDGSEHVIRAEGEVILCAGAIDTPRLLLLSGIGPSAPLADLEIPLQHDLPGVGENLIDHPESIMIWELNRPMPPETVMFADVGIFVNRLGADERPDLMYHTYQIPFTLNTERLGYRVPEHAICLTPNVTRAHSVGRLFLLGRDPDVKPALDFRYFTDPEGYDEQTIVDGLKLAREIAAAGPMREWLRREIAPGPDVTTDADLSRYGRAVHHTVYHPAGTCRMGSADDDLAVVTPDLRVRGVDGLRIADASIFPTMPTVNPMVTVLMIGERCADLVGAGAAAGVGADAAR